MTRREWELIGGWMDREDDEKGSAFKERRVVHQEQMK